MDLRQLAKKELDLLNAKPHLSDREKVVQEALTHVGYTEEEGNDNIFGAYYHFNSVAWCGLFCTYCYWVGAAVGLPDTNKGKDGLAYIPAAVSMLNKLNCLVAEPIEGDLVMFDFPGGVSADHIGIFHKWTDHTKKAFYAVEGNTSQKGHQSRGGAVEYQIRYVSQVCAYASFDKIKALKLQP